MACGEFLLAYGEKEYQKKRQTGYKPYDPQHFPFVFDPLPEFIEYDQESENDHAELEKETKLVIGPLQAFDKYKLIQGQHTKDHTLHDLVKKMQAKSPFFL